MYTNRAKQPFGVGTLLGEGGEGKVYEVPGHSNLVAKIYHTTHRTGERESKLQAMISNPPQDDTRLLSPPHVSIAWPLELLYERGRFAGYAMPRIERSPDIFAVFNPTLRKQRYPSFDWRYLHRTARNLSAAINALHARGYVVGDINQKNVLVPGSALVTLVDTDSFQVRDTTNGNIYRSPVGVPEYTPPELQGSHLASVDRQPQHDYFGLAVVIFQLLMEGFHPFTGKPKTPSPTLTGEIYRYCIQRGIFPYQKNPDFDPPPKAPDIAVLHPSLQALFIRTFVQGHNAPASRPSAHEWIEELVKAEQALVQCKKIPSHWYSSHRSTCHWCQREAPLPVQQPLQSTTVKVPKPAQTLPSVSPMTPIAPAKGTSGLAAAPPRNSPTTGRRSPFGLLLTEGISCIFVGYLLLANPLMTASIIVSAIGFLWVVNGALSFVRIFTHPGLTGWKLISGIIVIPAGWLLMINAGDGAVVIFGVTVIIVLAIQGIIMGIIGLIEASKGGGWGPGIIGTISMIIGILIFFSPFGYIAVLPWVIGFFAVIAGIYSVIMAFRLR